MIMKKKLTVIMMLAIFLVVKAPAYALTAANDAAKNSRAATPAAVKKSMPKKTPAKKNAPVKKAVPIKKTVPDKKVTPVKKTAEKKSTQTLKPLGVWRVVEAYSSDSPSGPFSKASLGASDRNFELSFKENYYCDSRLKDPTDPTYTKLFCEPLSFKKDGTFTGSRLEAWGGFMKLNGSSLEFYEGGKGFMKYVFKKK